MIESGPFLAAGTWPVLPSRKSSAGTMVLTRDYDVLWTFSDDYAACDGLCTHRARYALVGDAVWTSIPVTADGTGAWYATATLPAGSLAPGAYKFYFDVTDCAGQKTYAPSISYFVVE